MVRRTCLHLLELIAGLIAGTAILFLLGAWRLSQGPVSMSFLTPYVEQMLSTREQHGLRFQIDDTVLTWGGWSRGIDVRVTGVHVFGASGKQVGQLPELAVGVSAVALVHGVLAPSSIDLIGPQVTLRRTQSGTFEIGLKSIGSAADAAGSDVLERLLKRLERRGDMTDPFDYLRRVNVIDAEVILDDEVQGKTWRAPASYLSVERHGGGLRGEASLSLSLGGGPRTALDVRGTYASDKRQANVIVNFNDLAPAAMANLSPIADVAPMSSYLKTFDLPLSGTVAFGVNLDGAFDTVGVVLDGGAGSVRLPAPLTQTVPIDGAKLRATYDAKNNRLKIDELNLTLAKDARVKLPAPVDQAYDVRTIDAKLTADFNTQRLDLTKLDVTVGGGSKLNASAVVDGLGINGGAVSVDLNATVDNVAVDSLPQLWPKTIGDKVRDWVLSHLSHGRVPRAVMQARLWSADGGGFEVVSMNGAMRAEGVTVDYLPPMPPVKNVAAEMRFDRHQFGIWVEGGDGPGIKVRDGSIHLTKLDTDNEHADISLAIDGGVRPALELIDHEPLGFAQAENIDPKTAGGNAEVSLKLSMPLHDGLTLHEVKVSARALLENARVGNVLLGHDVTNGDLRLEANNDKMTVHGQAKIAGLPVNLRWIDNFADNAEFQSRYELATNIQRVSQLTELGIDLAPLDDQMLSGSIGARVRLTKIDDNASRVEAEADLTKASMEFPRAKWAKAAGIPGEARFTVSLNKDVITAIPRFEVTAGDLVADGSVSYGPKGGGPDTGVQRIDFSRLAFGRNDVKGALIAHKDGSWEIGLQGKSLDLAPFWEEIKSLDSTEPESDSITSNLTILAEIDKVYVGDKRAVRKVSATAARRNDLWHNVTLTGRLDGKTPFEFHITPDGPTKRQLSLTTPDAGRTLAFFDLYDGMRGGRLSITGSYDDSAVGHPLNGRVRVNDYRIVNAPLMARVLSIMALTGVLDAMQGEGLAFNELVLPFTLTNGTLDIANAHAAGRSLGFTASGRVYTGADVVNLQGTVVPAYAINSLLGRIPVLGDILTGPEAGGGVFAANFSMTGSMSDPKVTVNPLSALTPGILRGIFGFLGNHELADDKGADAGPRLQPGTPGE